ncbi:hypothetical protein [Aeromicrobium sp. PE09-221]|uniref:hypothetical protein n=1 Tax=Aeromicrobium sp. PE09-221 TaxID=1898043 RepID=UPI001F3AE152|nr:hypothetical protein [Aeromicrobium sp. PE09-221]
MPRWEIAGRALTAGCVTGGFLGAVVGFLGGIGADGTPGTGLGYAALGAMLGIPTGVILCLPGMIVATILFPPMVERCGEVAARSGIAVIVGLITGGCLVLAGAAERSLALVPIAMIVAALGLRDGRGFACTLRGVMKALERLVSVAAAVLVGLLLAMAVVAVGLAWMQSRGDSSLDPTFTRYPEEFMALSPLTVGVQAVPPSIPSGVVAVVSFGAGARWLGAGRAAGVAALGGSAMAVLMASGGWGGGSDPSLTAVLAGIGGVVAGVGAAGACALVPPLRSRVSV